jgi:hypothetical protein
MLSVCLAVCSKTFPQLSVLSVWLFAAKHDHNCLSVLLFAAKHAHNCLSVWLFAAKHAHNCLSVWLFAAKHAHNCLSVWQFAAKHAQLSVCLAVCSETRPQLSVCLAVCSKTRPQLCVWLSHAHLKNSRCNKDADEAAKDLGCEERLGRRQRVVAGPAMHGDKRDNLTPFDVTRISRTARCQLVLRHTVTQITLCTLLLSVQGSRHSTKRSSLSCDIQRQASVTAKHVLLALLECLSYG